VNVIGKHEGSQNVADPLSQFHWQKTRVVYDKEPATAFVREFLDGE
jgi:hypothetical protein